MSDDNASPVVGHWLDLVREGWDVTKISYVAKLASGHTPSRQRDDYWVDCTIPWISLGDVAKFRNDRAVEITETKEKISLVGLANSAAELLPEGTVCLSRTASVGFSIIMGRDMATTQDFANWVCGKRILPKFLLYSLRAMRPDFERLKMGSTHNTIYMPDIGTLQLAVPSTDLQRRAVEFVDRETVRIDTLIDKQRKLIELLKEKRQAVISQAVTKGLDSDVPMKDSGVTWLGEVPRHWSVVKLDWRYFVQLGKKLYTSRETGLAPRVRYLRNRDVRWTGINTDDLPSIEIEPSELHRYLLKENDMLACEGRDLGRAAIWKGGEEKTVYQMALHRLRARSRRRDDVDFLYYLFMLANAVRAFDSDDPTTTIPHLPAEDLRQMKFCFPPLSEQLLIVRKINAQLEVLDRALHRLSDVISLLQERRVALVTAAVTGQIDVTNHSTTPEPAAA